MGKKQHYVPQFYLKNFANAESRIGFYRFADDLYCNEAPVNSVLFKNWLYDQDNSYEQALSSMERQWSTSLNNLLDGVKDNKKIEERKQMELLHVLSFISFSEVRTKKNIDGHKFVLHNIVEDIRRHLGEDAFSKIPMFENIDFDYMPTHVNLEMGALLFKLLLDLDWLFVINDSDRDFITCDAPVASINPYLIKRQWRGGFGNGKVGLQKIVPLSNRVCLCLYDSFAYNGPEEFACVILTDKKVIKSINALLAENAMEQIVFHPSFPRCEAKGLCKNKKHIELNQELQVYESDDGKIAYGMQYIDSKNDLLLPWLSFNEAAMKIPLPSNAAGLVRPYIRDLELGSLNGGSHPDNMEPFIGKLTHVYKKNSKGRVRPQGIILDQRLKTDRN